MVLISDNYQETMSNGKPDEVIRPVAIAFFLRISRRRREEYV
jgi:hypothetical protein